MKQHLRSFLTLLMLVVWASGFAAEKTYSYTFNSKIFASESATNSLNKIDWTLSAERMISNKATYFGSDKNKGQQFGSGKNPVKTATFTTSGITGTIKSISVVAWNALTDSKTSLKVSVNGVSYGDETPLAGSSSNATSPNAKYTFNGNTKGEIKLIFTNNGSKGGFWFNTISVTYEDGPTKTLKSLAISGDATKKAYNDGEAFDPTGLVVTGTYDDNTTATITNGITWTTTPTKLTVGTTSCSVTATVNGVTSPAFNVTGLTVTKTTAIVFDFTANPNAWGITPKSSNGKNGSNVVAGKELEVSGIVMTATNGDLGTCLYGTTSVTLNVYQGGSITFTAPEGYNITEITFDGTNINSLEADKGTNNNGTWTGNAHAVQFSNSGKKIEIETASIKLVATFQTLDESKDNTETISNNDGKTIDIKLTRTLVANKWNTFCVPFETKIAGTALEGATVKAIGTVVGNVINLVDATKIEAGVPYLVMPTTGDIVNPTFKSVTITEISAKEAGNADYKFVGTYSPKPIAEDDFGKIWGVTAEGKLAKINEGTTMKGLRAYFVFPTNAAAAKLNFDGETTGINSIETEATVNGKVYNLNGQYVGNSLNGLKKGIYVVNGKKVIK